MSTDFKAENEQKKINQGDFEHPSFFIIAIVFGISALPFVFNTLGVEVGISPHTLPLDFFQGDISVINSNVIFNELKSAFSHTLLGWTAFCASVFTALFAFTYFRVHKNIIIPIIGIAILCAGVMHAFHVLVADHFVQTAAHEEELLPFIWTISRILSTCLVISVLMIILYYPQEKLEKKGIRFVAAVALLFGVIIYAVIQWSLQVTVVPQMHFPEATLKYPYDFVPVALLLGAAFFVYYPFYNRYPSFFSYALFLSIIPEIATESYIAFGFSKVSDVYFNVANALNIFGYILPFIGLCLDAIAYYMKSQNISHELALTNQKLDHALSQAQVATKAKSNFLASMTHELRTPMNGVIGMANLLSETKLDEEQEQQINIVKGCANSLLTVINDILDFSKIEAGKMEIKSVPFNLRKMCKETLDLVRFQAEGKDLKLELEFHKSVPDYIKSDPNRLRQVLLNFLSNAIKFTMKGHVKLILCCPESPSIEQEKLIPIRFSVEDTGVGIPENVMDILFQPFSQADSSTSRKFGGTGLGLAISMKLADLIGGKVWLKSLEGKGATFYLEAPFEQVSQIDVQKLEEKEQCAQGELDDRSLKILLAEDNRVNQMVALSILKKIGCGADVANNGLEVLEALDKKQYDLIFMDMMMPQMDGLEATKEICKRFKSGSYSGVEKPRIIAMTASAMSEDRERCFKAGMDDFMSKPIVLSELREKILATPQVTSGADPEAPSAQPIHKTHASTPAVVKTVVTFKGTRFEPQRVLKAFEGDEEMIPDMIDLFLKTSLEYVVNIKKAIDSQNASELQLQSHTLKGSVKIFYADRAIAISQALENLGQNKSFENAQDLYNDLEKELPLLQQELEEFKKKLA
ncbi:MAG TPA: hypothetical protein DD412_07315 [Holosporales bacterium]|nr:hypothetical protein [Holosporales bacterium]